MKLSTIDAIQKVILVSSKGLRHHDYERTVQLAKLYKQLITGEDIASLLRRIVRREDEEAFKQRLEITETVLPAISEKIMSPFSKVGRMDNVFKQVSYVDDPEDEKELELKATLKGFWGDEDLDSYMDTRFIELSFSDPNSFIMVEFEQFDSNEGKAQPRPMEVMSENVLDFDYYNNSLSYIVFRVPYVRKEVSKDGKISKHNDYRYFIYTPDAQIQLTKVEKSEGTDNTDIPVNDLGEVESVFRIKKDEKHSYEVRIFNSGARMVQGIRVGYKRDLITDGRTCVSPLHPAVNRMKKTIKTGSEFDLTMTLHAFPQKHAYVRGCTGMPQNTCRDGINNEGKECEKCGGTGIEIHTSAQDVVYFPIPKHKEDMMDLQKMVNYSSPDIALAKFQEEYSRRLEADAIKDVFSSDTFNRDTIVSTATEVVIDMQSVYDTLFPFSKKFSAVYEKLVLLSAVFTDNEEGLIVVHTFPKDFKLKSFDALISDRKKAMEANAPEFIKTDIDKDIAEKIWTDNPEKLREFHVKQTHLPFSGKTTDEIIYIVSSGNAVKEDVVLWSNFEAIFNELKLEYEQSGRDFFKTPYESRVEAIKNKVLDYQERINQEQSTGISFGETNIPPLEGLES